jgi:glycosyltransferase involved in cell wall biosynthesis
METYSARLAELLPEYCELDVIALPGRVDGRAPSGLSIGAFGVRAFIRGLVRAPADVVHIGDLAAWPLALPSLLRRPRATVIVSAHGTDVSFALRDGLANRGYRAYLSMFRRLMPAARIIANSRATAEALKAAGLNAHAIVPLAADQRNGTPAGTPGSYILFAGRLTRRKGLSWFVENVLDGLPPGITLKVAGPAWDASEAKALDHPRVEYLGTLRQDELDLAYRSAICVIVPNLDMAIQHFEGFGLVAPEAAASGGVVLGARTAGLSDAIRDGETGFLLPPGDEQAWRHKIAEIANWSEGTRCTFTQGSQDACQKHFSWARVARETFEQYGL